MCALGLLQRDGTLAAAALGMSSAHLSSALQLNEHSGVSQAARTLGARALSLQRLSLPSSLHASAERQRQAGPKRDFKGMGCFVLMWWCLSPPGRACVPDGRCQLEPAFVLPDLIRAIYSPVLRPEQGCPVRFLLLVVLWQLTISQERRGCGGSHGLSNTRPSHAQCLLRRWSGKQRRV